MEVVLTSASYIGGHFYSQSVRRVRFCDLGLWRQTASVVASPARVVLGFNPRTHHADRHIGSSG